MHPPIEPGANRSRVLSSSCISLVDRMHSQTKLGDWFGASQIANASTKLFPAMKSKPCQDE
jgi:hypothetical protein